MQTTEGTRQMNEPMFSKIMVEITGGAIVNITDLPKEQYEQFLELMHKIRIAYIATTSKSKCLS